MKAFAHYIGWLAGVRQAETQTTEAERDCLERHARGRRRLVEIGVWHGVTTSRLRRAMARDGCLTAVDPFPTGRLGFSMQERIARAEVGKIPNGEVTWTRTTGALAASNHEPIDFIFIDGDHTEDGLRADWGAWRDLVVPGGVVALHDSRSTPDRRIDDAGSVKVTRDVIARDPRFETIDEVDSLTVLRRKCG